MANITWAKSYDLALKSARAGKKLILIDFYADWCTWCKKLDADVYTNKGVVQISNQMVSVKLNTEREGTAMAQKYRVQSLPTIIMIDAEGNEWQRIRGYKPADIFVQAMQAALKSYREVPQQEAKLRQNPNDAALASKLLEQFTRQGNKAKTLWTLGIIEKKGPSLVNARTYGMVGEMFHANRDPNTALLYFNKSLALSRNDEERGLGHISLAFAYAAKQDLNHMRAELNTVIGLRGAPQPLKDQAKQILDRLPR